MRIKRNQAGDTIIEVLLAIAIVGMVLGASYSTATRALRSGRFAQEHTEALKLAESQMEKLKYLASVYSEANPPTAAQDIFNTGVNQNVFCIDDNFMKVLASDGTYTSLCSNISGLYKVSTTYDNTSSVSLFKVVVTWERTATTQGNVSVSYRLYK